VADELRTDVLGNVIATINGPAGARVSCSPGTATRSASWSSISTSAVPLLRPIGGVDAHLVPGQRVTVHAAGGPLPGVVGRRPIHQLETAERDKVMPFKSQFIDIGCQDRPPPGPVAVGDR